MDENYFWALQNRVDDVHVIHGHFRTRLDESEHHLTNKLLNFTTLSRIVSAFDCQVSQVSQYVRIIQYG